MSCLARVSSVPTTQSFNAIDREFQHVMNRVFGNDVVARAANAVDVREDADHLYVDAEVPGFSKDEVEITLENQTLTIAAEKKPAEMKSTAEVGYLLRERRTPRFQRAFKLPPTVDGSSVDAKLADGILVVTLTKRPETKPRKIAIA